MTIDHNLITGGAKKASTCPTASTPDHQRRHQDHGQQVRRARSGRTRSARTGFHDGDGNGVGLLIEGNEFTGSARERSATPTDLQTVWVGDHLVYRRNYVHDNRCQGFFVKDQASAVNGIVAEDNLFPAQRSAPCARPPLVHGQPERFSGLRPVSRASRIAAQHDLDAGRGAPPSHPSQGEGWADVEVDPQRSSPRHLRRAPTSTGDQLSAQHVLHREAAEGGAWPACAQVT